MKSMISLALLSVVIATVLRQSDATISCYVCVGSSVAKNGCYPPFTYTGTTTPSTQTNSSESITQSPITNSIAIATNCQYCETIKTTANGVTTYTRSCISTNIPNTCTNTAGTTSCIYTCDTNLCNTGSDASTVKYTLTSLAAAILFSSIAVMF
jgi:hypothetical protein